jgi:xanthine dehydrogenase YagR molybdenum-binding subunit
MDELAVELAMDPIELRIRNEPEKDPLTRLPFSQCGIVQAWRDGAARFGWDKRSATPAATREGDWLTGMGCATGTYPYYRMPRGAARLTITREGRATVAIAAHEMGMGTATVQAQVAAERLGLPSEQLQVLYGDTLFPGAVLAGGSQQTAAIGASIIAAHRVLVKELLNLAGNESPLAGLGPDEAGGFEGGLCALDDETRRESYVWILGRARREEVNVEAEAPMPLELQHWSNAQPQRAVLRGSGECRHGRIAREPFSRLLRLAAASSTPRRPRGAAASSWGLASRSWRRPCSMSGPVGS